MMQNTPVLVVEDDALLRDTLLRILKVHHYQVIPVENGQEALEYCRSHPIRLVITDINMPGKNGIGLIQDLKTEFPTIRIIGLSGWPEELRKASAVGIAAVFSKPFQVKELIDAIDTAMTG